MAIKFLDLEGLKKLWSKVKGRIDSAVSAEKSERQAADSSLSGVLTSESERAKNAESKNATAISNEASRAKSAEAKLTADLADESSRAIAKENSLSSALQSETSGRTAKDSVLEESINTESSSRASADTQLQNLIQAISSDYITSAELASAMSSSLTYKGSVNYIDNLPKSHKNGDVYNVVYYGESSQAGTEEWGMNVAWSAADNRWDRLGGVQDLHGYCLKANYMTSSEVALAITNALSEAKSYTYSKSQTDTLLTNANNSINNEKARAQVAEQKNANDISAEVSRAKSAESTLQTDINSKVKQINIGETGYSPSSGIVSLPEYPTSLPANGGNANTVNGHFVDSNVPENAKFTDTLYPACSINEYRNNVTITNRYTLGDSTHKWTKLAIITVQDTYIDSPIVFNIISRSYEAPSIISILFVNEDNANPSIDRFTATFKADFFIKQVADNKWELYTKSDNFYDYEHVYNVNTGTLSRNLLVDVNVQPVEDQDVNNMIKASGIYVFRSDLLSLDIPSTEQWTFTLEDGSTVTKNICIK